ARPRAGLPHDRSRAVRATARPGRRCVRALRAHHPGAGPMTRYAIDPPTLLRIVTEQLAVDPGHQLVAPNGIRSAALTLLLGQVRRGELTEKEAGRLHTRMTELKIRTLGDRVSRWTSFQIAREQGWETTYDAEYLAVARLQADALVTVDDDLARKAEGIVPVEPLAALTR